jgi:hypothetical protein
VRAARGARLRRTSPAPPTAAALPVGIAVGAVALVALMRFQRITVERQLGTDLPAGDPAQE